MMVRKSCSILALVGLASVFAIACGGDDGQTSSNASGGAGSSVGGNGASNTSTSASNVGGNGSASTGGTTGSAATGGTPGTSTNATGIVRGAASFPLTEVSGCTNVGKFNIPAATIVTATGATQWLYDGQLASDGAYNVVTCETLGSLAAGNLQVMITVADEQANFSVVGNVLIGQTTAASVTVYVASSQQTYGTPSGTATCELTPLSVTSQNMLFKVTCPSMANPNTSNTCGLGETYVAVENCAPYNGG